MAHEFDHLDGLLYTNRMRQGARIAVPNGERRLSLGMWGSTGPPYEACGDGEGLGCSEPAQDGEAAGLGDVPIRPGISDLAEGHGFVILSGTLMW
ncbi:hypothetical protein [Kitasatospora sp. NPDC050463]|uniref:hypothetical protein n=1 Tax=Kitasatospora sp. NPDC050463 TaxID=3155786 RepID=UPI0034037DED